MLKLVDICKNFSSQTGSQPVLNHVNIEIYEGEFFSLLGPSGCGKTTLLRIISGLETPTSGEIYWQNQRVDQLRSQKRPFNMVFQKYALFPHLTVYENVAFGLKLRGLSKDEIHCRVEKMLELVDMKAFSDRFPETLSGGQAQRIAVARAAILEPQILLLDEPLSALDQKMREHMQAELRELQRRLKITFILVTHDQEEALALSDRIAVMNRGVIEQLAPPNELYQQPQTHFVAQFIGSQSFVTGSANVAQPVSKGYRLELSIEESQRLAGLAGQNLHPQKPCDAFVRPENISLQNENHDNALAVEVSHIAYKGIHYELSLLTAQKQKLRAYVESGGQIRVGQKINVYFHSKDVVIFERPQVFGR